MRPLCLGERSVGDDGVSFAAVAQGDRSALRGHCRLTLSDYVDEIIAGGFPGMRHLSGRALTAQLDAYVRRIVEHDLPEAGQRVRRPATVLAWLRAYAAATATTATWETIRDAAAGASAAPARSTTVGYTELLTALRILDPIEAWIPSTNHLARLGAAPKHHLTDPALAVRLLQRTRQHLLRGDEGGAARIADGRLLGNVFESLAALSVRALAQGMGATVAHLRQHDGRHEIDFIVDIDGGVLAIEAKLGAAVDDADVRHLLWLQERLGNDLVDAVVLTTGSDAYRRPDGIAVVPLGSLTP